MAKKLRYVFVFFILINLFLLYVYIFSINKNYYLTFLNKIPFIEKDFVIFSNYNYSQLNNGKVVFYETDSENISDTTTVIFKVKALNKPIYNTDKEYYYVPVRVHGLSKIIKFNLILGNKNDVLPTMVAIDGIIDYENIWTNIDINDLIRKITKNKPLIVELNYKKDIENLLKNKNCNINCKEYLKNLQYNSNSISLVFEAINKKTSLNSNIYIGNLISLIVYE